MWNKSITFFPFLIMCNYICLLHKMSSLYYESTIYCWWHECCCSGLSAVWLDKDLRHAVLWWWLCSRCWINHFSGDSHFLNQSLLPSSASSLCLLILISCLFRLWNTPYYALLWHLEQLGSKFHCNFSTSAYKYSWRTFKITEVVIITITWSV